jgi:phytanoyl-CoA dioxygenase PhyH
VIVSSRTVAIAAREITMTESQTHRIRLFHQQSYFVLPGFLEPAEYRELCGAADVILQRTRAVSEHEGHTTPSISLLSNAGQLAQEPDGLERLLRFVSSTRICGLLDGLTAPTEDPTPRLQKTDYYHEQTVRDWDGDWHRDSQFNQVDPERERARVLTTTALHVRVALHDDDRLEVVPGSHRRWDSEAELAVRKGARRASAHMPQATRIVLRAGDVCVFHAWSIHRGTYRRTPLRRTLDALYTFGRAPDGPFAALE